MKTFRIFLTPDRVVEVQAAKIVRHQVDKDWLAGTVRAMDEGGDTVALFVGEAVVGWAVVKA